MITRPDRLLMAPDPQTGLKVVVDLPGEKIAYMFAVSVYRDGSTIASSILPPMFTGIPADAPPYQQLDRFAQIAKIIGRYYNAREVPKELSWMDTQLSEAKQRMVDQQKEVSDILFNRARSKGNYNQFYLENIGIRLDPSTCFWLPPNILGT